MGVGIAGVEEGLGFRLCPLLGLVEDQGMSHADLMLGGRFLLVLEEVIVFIYLKHRCLSLHFGELGGIS